MVSLISSPNFKVFQQPILSMNSPCIFPIFLVISPPRRQYPLKLKRKQLNKKKQNQLLLDFSECCGVVRMCKKFEGDCDPRLELEVLEFMKNSKNPEVFPSKKQLIEAGREDLVEAIVNRGGWMSIGWVDDEIESGNVENGSVKKLGFDIEKYGKSDDEGEGRTDSVLNDGDNVDDVSFFGNSSSDTSSSGRSIEVQAVDDSGIEGILRRLEKQRNLYFGITLKNNESLTHGSGNSNEKEQTGRQSNDFDSCHPEESQSLSVGHDRLMFGGNGSVRSYSDTLSSPTEVDTWRAWSFQRAGFSEKEFEAAEIDFGGNQEGKITYNTTAGPTDVKEGVTETLDLDSFVREFSQSDVRTRLQQLESELSSALRSFIPDTGDLSEKAMEQLSEDLSRFSDASEFQENEIMHAQDKLRSIRAKLAVLEGKMALAIIDAQKILSEKEKRIDNARHALQLLRTVCIVWPNSGSEVLLAGSFDGWATQRKMERSSSGIFSLQLKLYPGKYEMKFIVDGIWMVDPLRPIMNNNGFDNNLLTVT